MPQSAIADENGLAPASLHRRVYENLRSSLIAGRFAPGEVLSLRRIAAANGMSPMPVREAVKQLISEGAIELLPNRTIAVRKLRRRDFVELTRVREMLEGHAAELASARATPTIVLSLARKNTELIQCVVARDMTGAMRMNQEFHFDLYRASQSLVLIPLIEALWMRMGPVIHVSLGRPGVNWSASEHHAALHALEQRDHDGVRRAIERDIRSTADELLTLDIFAPD